MAWRGSGVRVPSAPLFVVSEAFHRSSNFFRTRAQSSYAAQMARPEAIVYIDGFNLYRRALQGTPYKWLDIARMADLLLQDFSVTKVRYFTAHIKHQPHDAQAPQRQQAYLRALCVDPRVHIHLGTFRMDKRLMPVHPLRVDGDGRPVTALVRKMEEKGSDVNLATHLLLDGFRNEADSYVVVSNDSDLAEPMRVLVHDFQRTVGLITPSSRPSHALLQTKPKILRQIREGLLAEAQMPDRLRDQHGFIHRPKSW